MYSIYCLSNNCFMPTSLSFVRMHISESFARMHISESIVNHCFVLVCNSWWLWLVSSSAKASICYQIVHQIDNQTAYRGLSWGTRQHRSQIPIDWYSFVDKVIPSLFNMQKIIMHHARTLWNIYMARLSTTLLTMPSCLPPEVCRSVSLVWKHSQPIIRSAFVWCDSFSFFRQCLISLPSRQCLIQRIDCLSDAYYQPSVFVLYAQGMIWIIGLELVWAVWLWCESDLSHSAT